MCRFSIVFCLSCTSDVNKILKTKLCYRLVRTISRMVLYLETRFKRIGRSGTSVSSFIDCDGLPGYFNSYKFTYLQLQSIQMIPNEQQTTCLESKKSIFLERVHMNHISFSFVRVGQSFRKHENSIISPLSSPRYFSMRWNWIAVLSSI